MSADAREDAIRRLLPMVRQLARRVQRMVPRADIDDLIGDGCIGLIRAVDGYDAAREVPLELYARRVVLGAILNGVRRMDPVSERMRRTLRHSMNVRFELAQELGTLPGQSAMERITPELASARTQAHRRSPLSLDAALPSGERLDIDHTADPQEIVAERAERDQVRCAVAELPPRQRRIVCAHYFGERRLRDLVAPMQISPQRVSQLHLLALRRLRGTLASIR